MSEPETTRLAPPPGEPIPEAVYHARIGEARR